MPGPKGSVGRRPPRRETPGAAAALSTARAAYRTRAWSEAHRLFADADRNAALEAADLEVYAWSAALLGRDDEFIQILERVYRAHLDAGESLRAARCAFWAGQQLSVMGETARAGGWLARAERLAEDRDCVERGYLLLPVVRRHNRGGDLAAAHAAAAAAVSIADRFRDPDLGAFARALQGNLSLRLGQVERGLALLDEAMVAVTGDELNPVFTGLIYCTCIAACGTLYIMDRARQWTAALAAWCDAQPDLVPFNGTCLVHRAELLQIGGAWEDAIEEARRASARVTRTDLRTAADSAYQQAEVYRLRGDFVAAERAYREAGERGRDVQPGLALLRLAQGRVGDAVTSIRRVLVTTEGRLLRARLLPAYVEIALRAGAIEEARGGCVELESIAAEFGAEILNAMAAHARGAVELADGHAGAALDPLRRAFRVWHEAGAPYIAARLRVLLAQACRALGDRDTAALEDALARETFERLGAAPDLAALAGGKPRATPDGLSPRELEVLRLVATGKANKLIAKELHLSGKTIERHISNIFTKTGVASRAAATAYAYQHGLV